MAQPYELVAAEGEQNAGRGAMHDGCVEGSLPPTAPVRRRSRRQATCPSVNEIRWRARLWHAEFLLKAERDGEKPAHAGVDAMVASQKEEREPNVAIVHRSCHVITKEADEAARRLLFVCRIRCS